MRAGVEPNDRRAQVGTAPAGATDLAALGRALWRRRVLIAGLTVLAAALAAIAVNLVTPRFKAEARILIAARDNGMRPALQLLLYPVTDLRGTTASRSKLGEGFVLTRKDLDLFVHYLLEESDLDIYDPRVSPILFENFADLPPAIVATAGFDPLRDEG